MSIEERMLAVLKLLRERAPKLADEMTVTGRCYDTLYVFRHRAGICPNVENNMGSTKDAYAARDVLKKIIRTWDKCVCDRWGAPNLIYPVDDYEYGGYARASDSGELWTNPLRLELLDYIIGELEHA